MSNVTRKEHKDVSGPQYYGVDTIYKLPTSRQCNVFTQIIIIYFPFLEEHQAGEETYLRNFGSIRRNM